MKYDEVFQYTGGYGVFQVTLYIMLGVVGWSNGWQSMAANFLVGNMDHWCLIPELQNLTFQQQKYIAIPKELPVGGVQRYSQCWMFALNYSQYTYEEFKNWNWSIIDVGNITRTTCHKWVYDQSLFVSSAVSEFDLVCDRSHLAPLASSIYIAGMLVGAVSIGALSDRIGRHKALLGCKFTEIAFAIAAVFAPNYVVWVLLRCVVGLTTLPAYGCAFVMMVETVGPNFRQRATLGPFYALGFMLLPGYAYFVRDFRKLQVLMAVPMLVFVSYIWLLPESARWSLYHGRKDDAIRTLSKIAAVNHRPLPKNLQFHGTDPSGQAEKANLLDIFKYRRMTIRTFIIFFLWVTVSMVYFGLSLNTGSLAGDIFLNTFLMASMELIAFPITMITLDTLGRRITLGASYLISGAALLACIPIVLSPGLQVVKTVLSLIGKLGSSVAFMVDYIFTAELYPTIIRNAALGAASTSSRIGGMVSPQLGKLDQFWLPLPSLVFGVFSLLAGIASFFLPETLRKKLPETMHEGEEFGLKIRDTSLHDSDMNNRSSLGRTLAETRVDKPMMENGDTFYEAQGKLPYENKGIIMSVTDL